MVPDYQHPALYSGPEHYPTADQVMKIANRLMAKLHRVIKPPGIVTRFADNLTLSWHTRDGWYAHKDKQIAVLALWLDSNSHAFEIELQAGVGQTGCLRGRGQRGRWIFLGRPDEDCPAGFYDDFEEDDLARFRFDDPFFKQFSCYDNADPDIVEAITAAVEDWLASELWRL